eukprot:2998339-Prorocentrum_lima.AAC.1
MDADSRSKCGDKWGDWSVEPSESQKSQDTPRGELNEELAIQFNTHKQIMVQESATQKESPSMATVCDLPVGKVTFMGSTDSFLEARGAAHRFNLAEIKSKQAEAP